MTFSARSWHADELAKHVGRRITAIRPLNDIEIASEDWGMYDPGQTAVIILDDGSALIVQADAEGNGPGYLQSGHLIR
jgi:hypothetical protein